MGSAGTRERIIAANQYNPKADAHRKTMLVGRIITTEKKPGDIVIGEHGKVTQV